jgi:DNA processing protein
VTRRAGNDERFALAALTWIGEPGDARLGAMVRVHGPVKALELIQAGRLPSAPKTRRILGRWRAAAGQVPGRADLAAVFHSGLRLICPGDSEWPAGLAALGEAAPLALWARGSADLAEACARSVAITGTRACTAFGSQAAQALAAAVSGRGWAVISGGAFGIDTAAHRGAIGAGRSTVAVLAGGLDHPYPRGHRWLTEAVAERGVLVSEHPPGRRATRARFLARNRVIAALACGTVIAEAFPRSSALEAARCAWTLGRPVMAVPGSIAGDWSSGCHALIRGEHAVLVTSGEEIIETITSTLAAARAGQGRSANDRWTHPHE